MIYLGSTVFPSGSPIRPGQTVSVEGNFNVAGQLLATRVSIFTLYHIATWAYDNYFGQGEGASAAAVRQLVTYAQSEGKGLVDCHSSSPGCKAVFYLRPYALVDNSPASCASHPDADVLAAASESWFAHNSGYPATPPYRIYGLSITGQGNPNGCTMWGMNPNSTAMQTWWHNYLQSNADNYDMYIIDMADMNILDEYWYNNGGGCLRWDSSAHHGCYSTREMPNNVALMSAHVNFVNAMSHRNGSPMSFLWQQTYPTGKQATLALDLSALAATNRFVGVTCEGCLVNKNKTVVPSNYAPYLDTMAAINASRGAFLMESTGNAPIGSATEILQRLVTAGMMWLGYSEGHTIVLSDLEAQTKNLAIWPEDLIYPAAPLETMISGSTDLEVSPDVYRREFANCYYRAVHFGHCAAVVNANPFAVYIRSSWFRQTYHHVITLSGGDVLSGGIANISGASLIPGLTSVQAGGAMLLAP